MTSLQDRAVRVAVYTRVSSDEQRERQEILTQKGEVARYCAVAGDEVIGEYADDGVSGMIPFEQRPEGRRLLADAAARRFDAIVVYRFDRLARSQLELWRCVDALQRLGIALRSIKESVDTTTPAGKMFLGVLASMAEFERDSIRQRSMDGCKRVAREGRWTGGPHTPFGYAAAPKGKLDLVTDQAATVRQIYRLYIEGLNTYEVADYLDGRGVLGAAGRTWNNGTVHRILRSPTYVGELAWGKRRVVKRHDGTTRLVATAPEDRQVVAVPAIVDRPPTTRPSTGWARGARGRRAGASTPTC